MKRITFRADERDIEIARAEARARKTTLNEMFREWLEKLTKPEETQNKLTER